ncbi:hypothetical protein [Streptomyces sp. NPDC058092]|uniref:hypothetical protein n=1 Tax=Streptomyces sp. NPDC058092 TaxID=3346336 RepID=UPI0036E9E632
MHATRIAEAASKERVAQLGLEDGVLIVGEVLLVPAQEFADGTDGVALADPAAVPLPDEAAAQVGEVALGELHECFGAMWTTVPGVALEAVKRVSPGHGSVAAATPKSRTLIPPEGVTT